jgi:hypothetical protein
MVTDPSGPARSERDLAALMASQGVTDSDLAEALKLLAAKRAGEES